MITCFSAAASDCHGHFDNPHTGVSDDSAARAGGWAGLPYPDGVRYVCPACRRPLPRPTTKQAPADDSVTQLDMFLM